MTKYWNRLINMNDDRLSKNLFLYDKSHCKNNWESDFKSICNSVGMSDKFNTLIEMNVNTFTMNIKANYDKKWKADLHLPFSSLVTVMYLTSNFIISLPQSSLLAHIFIFIVIAWFNHGFNPRSGDAFIFTIWNHAYLIRLYIILHPLIVIYSLQRSITVLLYDSCDLNSLIL